MITTSIRIEDELLEKIKFLWDSYGKNKTEIIRDFLRDKTENEFNKTMEMIEFGKWVDKILKKIDKWQKTFTHEEFMKL